MATVVADEDTFVLIPFDTFMGRGGGCGGTNATAKYQVKLENVDGFASSKRKNNIQEELIVTKAPPLSLEPLADNLLFDNKDSLHLERKLSR